MLAVQLRSAQPDLDPRVTRISSSITSYGWRSIIVFWNRGGETSSGKSMKFRAVFSTPVSLANPSLLVMPILLTMFYLRSILFLAKLQPTVCIAHQLDVLPPALLLRSLKRNVKVVFDNEDVYSLMISRDTPKVVHAIIRVVERQLARKADLCVFPNGAMKNYLGLHDRPQTLVVPNLPEVGFAANQTIKRNRKKRNDQTFTIVYFGLITRYRGLENLIKAIELVTSKGVSVLCTLIGDGPIVPELRDLAMVCRVSDRVRFLNRVSREKIPELVGSFDASAILNTNQDPMNWIGDPNKLYECMALGVPVIASNFGEISEIVRSVDCGVLVNPDDANSVAAAILRLSNDIALRGRLSRNGVEAMRTKYSWERVERKLVEAMGQLAVSSE